MIYRHGGGLYIRLVDSSTKSVYNFRLDDHGTPGDVTLALKDWTKSWTKRTHKEIITMEDLVKAVVLFDKEMPYE